MRERCPSRGHPAKGLATTANYSSTALSKQRYDRHTRSRWSSHARSDLALTVHLDHDASLQPAQLPCNGWRSMSTYRVMSGTDAACANYQPARHNRICRHAHAQTSQRRPTVMLHARTSKGREQTGESRATIWRADDELATGSFLLPTASPASRPSALPHDQTAATLAPRWGIAFPDGSIALPDGSIALPQDPRARPSLTRARRIDDWAHAVECKTRHRRLSPRGSAGRGRSPRPPRLGA